MNDNLYRLVLAIIHDDKLLCVPDGKGGLVLPSAPCGGSLYEEVEPALKQIEEQLDISCQLEYCFGFAQNHDDYEYAMLTSKMDVAPSCYRWIDGKDVRATLQGKCPEDKLSDIESQFVRQRYRVTYAGSPEETVYEGECSFIEARREWNKAIVSQTDKPVEHHGEGWFRRVTLYDENGKEIIHES